MRARVLTFRYVGALVVVAGLLISGQTVIHQVLARQEGDTRVINLAGRQRMLGQRLCTLLLTLDDGDDAGGHGRSQDHDRRDELVRTADAWAVNQAALRAGRPQVGPRAGTSSTVHRLFAQIDADHRAMLAAAHAAIMRPPGSGDPEYARTACAHQEAFLAGMDRIVSEYEREAERRIIGLRRLELILLALALLVLALEGVFVFRPAVRHLRQQLAEREIVQRALDASEAEKQAMLRACSDRLLVWSRTEGWAELHGDGAAPSEPHPLAEPVPTELAAACLERAEHALATGALSRFTIRTAHRACEARLQRIAEDRLLVAIRDVTEIAYLEQQLLAASDREQLQLAQDLHDGLSQHLVGATFLLQPLRKKLGNGPLAEQLDEVGKLLGEAIGQARDLTRGLHSPTLELAGLGAALGELAVHTTRVFGVACEVHDLAGFEPPVATSTHLHRIAREAAVNAAKHASATTIEIEIACEAGELTLVVRDDGIGIGTRPPIGMGLRLMAYRAKLLGASLQIAAGPRCGTTVTCRVPLRELAAEGGGS